MKRRLPRNKPQPPVRVLEPRELARVNGGHNEIELPAPVPASHWYDDWLAPV